MQNPMLIHILELLTDKQTGSLESSILSFHRKFTLSDCLPELPPKTFYIWQNEGLIPDTFGFSKSAIKVITHSGYKKWSRYNVYEFFWIRLVYHLRQIGYSKEYISDAAKVFFPNPSEVLTNKVEVAFKGKDKEIRSFVTTMRSKIGSKGATHEIEKIENILSELLYMGDLHFALLQALTARKELTFLALQTGRIIPANENKTESGDHPALRNLDSIPHIYIPFISLLNDLVLVAGPEFLSALMAMKDEEKEKLEVWKKSRASMKILKFNMMRSSKKAFQDLAVKTSKDQDKIVFDRLQEYTAKLRAVFDPTVTWQQIEKLLQHSN